MSLLKQSVSNVHHTIVRHYGVNVHRWKKGLAPRFAYSALSETPEFSYTDGKGFSPLNSMQKSRYERDQRLVAEVVKHLKQFEQAKQLAAQQSADHPPSLTASTADVKHD
jgi:hypothetical protein